nr:unnamed protein product [Callosobruchus analis]
MRNAATGMRLAVAYVHMCWFCSPSRHSIVLHVGKSNAVLSTCLPGTGMPVSVYTHDSRWHMQRAGMPVCQL